MLSPGDWNQQYKEMSDRQALINQLQMQMQLNQVRSSPEPPFQPFSAGSQPGLQDQVRPRERAASLELPCLETTPELEIAALLHTIEQSSRFQPPKLQ